MRPTPRGGGTGGRSDSDSPWKEALDRWFEPYLAFYHPQAHADIDWARPVEFLDKELQQVTRDAEQGRRYADKLAKVWLKSGQPAWLLIHVEIQGYREQGFGRRAFVYNVRIFDRYNVEVVTLVLLVDRSRKWQPTGFRYGRWGSETSFRFEPVKLLGYAGREAALEADPNPFAAITLAQLKALETRRDPAGRYQWKLRLVRNLYERGLGARDVRELFRVIDWMLELPRPLDHTFWHELERLEQEKRMPYVTSVERLGMEKGQREERLEAIEALLEVRFGAAGLALMPAIKPIEDLDVLKKIRELAKTASTLNKVRRAIPS